MVVCREYGFLEWGFWVIYSLPVHDRRLNVETKEKSSYVHLLADRNMHKWSWHVLTENDEMKYMQQGHKVE